MGTGREVGAKEAKEGGKEAEGSTQKWEWEVDGHRPMQGCCGGDTRAMHVRCKGNACAMQGGRTGDALRTPWAQH